MDVKFMNEDLVAEVRRDDFTRLDNYIDTLRLTNGLIGR